MTVVIVPIVAVLVIAVLPVLAIPVLVIAVLPALAVPVLMIPVLPALAVPVLTIAIAPAPAVLVFPIVPGAVEPGLVFCRSNEVHGPIAGVVFIAVLAPVPRVPGGHVQVDGRRRGRLALDQHRPRIHEGRSPVIAKLNLTVYAGRHFTR
jgi:hypothetical protein